MLTAFIFKWYIDNLFLTYFYLFYNFCSVQFVQLTSDIFIIKTLSIKKMMSLLEV